MPAVAVEAIAGQVGVTTAAWQSYGWCGRAIEYHRAQIRAALGFREATLDGQVLALERRLDRLLAAARERCQSLHLEPPSPERRERLVRSVLRRHEDTFSAALFLVFRPASASPLGVGEDAVTPGPSLARREPFMGCKAP